jgi:peroxiredoxin
MSMLVFLSQRFVVVMCVITLVQHLGCTDDCRRIPKFELKDLNGNSFESTRTKSAYTLYILFSLDDCPICLFEAEGWQQAYERFPPTKLFVVGITQTTALEKLSRFRRDYRIAFPILQDPTGNVTSAFHRILSGETGKLPGPIKLIADSSRRIIYYEFGTKDMKEQNAFYDRISSKIDLRK